MRESMYLRFVMLFGGIVILMSFIGGCDGNTKNISVYEESYESDSSDDIIIQDYSLIHETVDYPAGKVERRGNLLISSAIVAVSGSSPVEIAKAKRAAQVVAMRNAGWYLSGVRIGEDGRLHTTETPRASCMTLRAARERESSYDQASQKVTAIVEVEFQQDPPGFSP